MRIILGLAALWIAACDGEDDDNTEMGGTTPSVDFSPEPSDKVAEVGLSEGTPAGGAVERTPPAKTSPLSAAETEQLLSRLPPLEEALGDQTDFAMREASLPPPQTGAVIDLAFPPAPDDGPPEVAAGPLEVSRWSPEGDVLIAPQLSVTFSQPMVAVGTVAETSAQVPVKLSPQPPGQWRWVGSRTLLFEPEGQFPKATEYTVTVPADTPSANGALLGESFSGTFSTPPLRRVSNSPSGSSVELEPLITLAFDQRIDVQALSPYVKVRAGQTAVPWRLATAAEISAKGLEKQTEQRKPERTMVIRAKQPLPKNTPITVTVEAGAPSAEGPRRTTSEQTFSFSTYGPLEVDEARCGYRDRCRIYDRISLQLSNPLDAEAFETEQVNISPELETGAVYASGSMIYIDGTKTPQTKYTITLSEALRDVFGQTVEGERVFSFTTAAEPDPPPSLGGFPREMLILDPEGDQTVPLRTMNMEKVRLQVFSAGPEEWGQWRAFRKWMYYPRNGVETPPGRLVKDVVVKTSTVRNTAVETAIDIKPYLQDGHGQLVLWVQSVGVDPVQNVAVWVQATELGFSAAIDSAEVLGWVTSLHDGASVEGAQVRLVPAPNNPQPTDADGIARLLLPHNAVQEDQVLVAEKDGDVTILPQNQSYWSSRGSWVKRDPYDQLLWFVFDDRKMYRPGESVKIKGWIRTLEAGEGGDTRGLEAQGRRVNWQLRDVYGNDVASGTADLTPLGGFDLSLDLPDTINLGYAQLSLDLPAGAGVVSGAHTHSIEIQEFRRPEFEVTAQAEPGPVLLGERTTITANGSYYAGGALPGAPVRWSVSASPSNYRPPNHEAYRFGQWTPWWYGSSFEGNTTEYMSLSGTTDASGTHYLELHPYALGQPRPLQLSISASITDVNRQTWSADTSTLVHPAAVYVGVRPDRPFYPKGVDVAMDLIAVDIDGEIVTERPITVAIVRRKWKRNKRGGWDQEVVEEHDCKAISAAAPRVCRFTPEAGGAFEVTARVTDALGRPNQTVSTVWVSGAEPEAARSVGQATVTLVPDKDQYLPGDVAEVLVQSPIVPAEALVTWRRDGVVHVERVRMETASTVLNVPIEDGHVPNLHVQVDVVGAAARTDAREAAREDLAPRPAYGSGSLSLPVSTLRRALNVSIAPEKTALPPGGEADMVITVTDPDGEPVSNAEVTVLAVDESVLALTGYRIADPIGVFYPTRGAGVSDYANRSALFLDDPEAIEQRKKDAAKLEEGEASRSMNGGSGRTRAPLPPAPAPASEAKPISLELAAVGYLADTTGAEKNGSGPVIAVRSNFDPLAMFVPAVSTDSSGQAKLRLTLPDNLTRYRITAIAVEGGKRFGKEEATITAQLPLMLRPSPPRFLNFGDQFALPVVVQNQTEETMTVDLAVRATNALFTTESGPTQSTAGRRVQVAAGDRVEVRFPTTTDSAGTARFQVAVASGSFADAATAELPVWTPATSEAFATYGQIDSDGKLTAIRQPIAVPEDVWPQFGGVEITTSTTAVGELTDAVIYLVDYPYGCAEQISSRVLAIAALRDVLDAFDAAGLPEPEALRRGVEADLEELTLRQNRDGGFGFWRKGERSSPFVTLHVAHAVVRAKSKKFAAPEPMRRQLMQRVQRIEDIIPREYGATTRRMLMGYALYIRHLDGDSDPQGARRLFQSVPLQDHSLEMLGWLLPILHEDGAKTAVDDTLKFLNNRVTETAAAAHFVTSYGEEADVILHSNRRTDAILLDALIQVRPDNDLIPKLVEGLMGDRQRGRWGSTQENAFVLLAMDRYFNTYEKTTPDLVARAWLGQRLAGEQAFRGRNTEKAHINAPMAWMQEAGGDVTLANDGAGRLYYRIGMRYAPKDLNLAPREAGFAVERVYEAVDDPEDVKRDADGTWRIRAGSRVRVRLTMAAPGRRSHVALVDPLPAGLEVLNPELAVTEALPPDPQEAERSRGRYWWRPWYIHENLRDERVEAFAYRIYGGVYQYTYVARATTPGSFVVPPTKAEEMYHPETFGRTGTDRVVVFETQ